MRTCSIEPVAAAIAGAPAAHKILLLSQENPEVEDVTDDMIDKEVAIKRLETLSCPILFAVGSIDHHLGVVKKSHSLLKEMGKESYLDIYPDEPHGFYWGPVRRDGEYNPSEVFQQFLNKAVAFCNEATK